MWAWVLALIASVALARGGAETAGQPSRPSEAQGTRGALPGEVLVWSDEFDGTGAEPDRANWAFETGGGGWGNHELETYCAYGSMKPPCDRAEANAFVGPAGQEHGGFLHVVARRDAGGRITSARLSSEGLESFQYGRVEARIRIPVGQGVWPAFWMLGADIKRVPWPACGELDIMENIGKEPATVHGSIHGSGFTGLALGKTYRAAGGAALGRSFHRFGMEWEPGRIRYYVDDPAHPYATFTPADLPAGAVWPFDGRHFFLLLNLAMGGDWPGDPDASTRYPAEMLVDYVRVYRSPKGTAGLLWHERYAEGQKQRHERSIQRANESSCDRHRRHAHQDCFLRPAGSTEDRFRSDDDGEGDGRERSRGDGGLGL